MYTLLECFVNVSARLFYFVVCICFFTEEGSIIIINGNVKLELKINASIALNLEQKLLIIFGD